MTGHLPAPAGLRNTTRFIPELESLRGWAILLVVVFHYFGILLDNNAAGANSLPESSSLLLRLAGAGNTGVTLFFVLSGFLLVQPFIHAHKRNEMVSISRFYEARLLRILPLYYLAVLVAWLVTSNAGGALKALLFIPVGFQLFPFSVPWWSLCTEMQFYLLLPWIMLALRYQTSRRLVITAGSVWLLLNCLHATQSGPLGFLASDSWQSSLFGRGPAFLIGGLCGWVYQDSRFSIFSKSPRRVTAFFIFLLLGMIFLLQWYGKMGQRPALEALPIYHNVEAVLWGGLLLFSLHLPEWLKPLFINPVFKHFGMISYSLYLVHVPIQFYLIYPVKEEGLTTQSEPVMLAAILGSFMLSWLLAMLCYRTIEKPFLRLKSHLPVLTDRLRERRAR